MPLKAIGFFLLLVARAAAAQSCPAGPHGLVLSGGGARGFAQLGALAVLDSAGLRPDLITGTSSGALTGALYGSGLNARQIDSVSRAADLASVFEGSAPLAPRAFGAVSPVLFWEQGRGGLSIFSASTLDSRLNARLNVVLLDANLAAGGDFDALPIPFAAVASDLIRRQRVVLRTGDLARAVRASMSIPLLFQPQYIDGRYLVDGAVVDNVPVIPARQLGAVSLTVVDVTTGANDSVDVHSTAAIARHLLEQQMLDASDSLGPLDSYIRPRLTRYGNLDFSRARLREAVLRGVEAAGAALARGSCMPARNRPPVREQSLVLSAVRIHAARSADRRFLQRAFGLETGRPLDPERIRAAFRDMEHSPEPREIWLNPRRTADSLTLDVELVASPPRAGGILLGYDHDYGGRIGALFMDRTLLDGYAQVALSVTASRYQQHGSLALRPEPVSWNPLLPSLHLRLAHESLQRPFGDAPSLPELDTWEGEAALLVERVLGGHWAAAAGPLLHAWDSDSAHGTSAGARVTLRTGSELQRPLVEATGTWTTDWWTLGAALEAERRTGPWGGRLVARAEVTSDAPPQRAPALGGANAFPGYAVFDLRGEHTAYAELSASRTLLGPFEVRLAGALGRSWRSHTDEWLGGARLTLELPTPAGALRVGYGRSSVGTGAVFVRLGAWF